MNTLYNQISQITKKEPNLMFRSEGEIEACANSGGLIYKLDGFEPIGFILCKDLSSEYVEIGCLYVNEKYRKNGIGTSLLEEALSKCIDKKVIVRTKEKKIKIWLKKVGFEPVSMKTNWEIAFIYLKDRVSNFFKMKKFIGTINNNSCVFIKYPNSN